MSISLRAYAAGAQADLAGARAGAGAQPAQEQAARRAADALAPGSAVTLSPLARELAARPPVAGAGAAREQLTLLPSDGSGVYIVNPHHVARLASVSLDQAWRDRTGAMAMAEYKRSGKLTQFFSALLDQFRKRSPGEQARYPEDYASDLEERIRLDLDYRSLQGEGAEFDPARVVAAMLARQAAASEGSRHA